MPRRSSWAGRLAEHLLPRTRAYHEIWLDGEKIAARAGGGADLRRDLPAAKFKTAIAVPPVNDVDIFAQDLGFIAIVGEAARSPATT